MKITKFVHSCLLVEMPEPINRTVLFDPGNWSDSVLDVKQLQYLDDIVITHSHQDHMYLPLIDRLVARFPDVRITSTPEVVEILSSEGIKASSDQPGGMNFFNSPHENVEPLFAVPQEIGVHYLDRFTHPGDSHSFTETEDILALPVQAPWGSMLNGVRLALELKPKHVIPIHDWHWNDEARTWAYGIMESLFDDHDIKFYKMETGVPIVI